MADTKKDKLWDTYMDAGLVIVDAAFEFAAEHDPLLHDSEEGLALHDALDKQMEAAEALEKIAEFDSPVEKTAGTAVN